jgi:hypothetical protein
VYRKILSSKLCFSPSQTEGFGIAILEYLALEKKVVCLPLPVLKGIYSDLIYYSDDMSGNSLALKCFQILNNKIDKIDQLKVKKFIEYFDWNNIFDLELNHE